MARKMAFKCDGCGCTASTDGPLPPDWSHVVIDIDGFKSGYPSVGHCNGVTEYDWCVDCQKRFAAAYHPSKMLEACKIDSQSTRAMAESLLRPASSPSDNGETIVRVHPLRPPGFA